MKLRLAILVFALLLLIIIGWRTFLSRPNDDLTGQPTSATDYARRGNGYLDRSDYDRAIADYTKAIALAPGDISAYVGRGLAYHFKGEKGRAAADFQVILRLMEDQNTRHRVTEQLQAIGPE
ncbi:MAG: tetratricopeptide repeat protein [Candidatus Latescibacteria bacterium]|nr:tetratricopeptide repeat protein [Candidatus Latescibacterota bacterium]